ncbi:anhydro-N-acetylmuramic acid kinase [Vespertiliibacter pulmonis]|uniref:Anhydro-N-acetylmuramic acid kinase n=1 Tax=Vespertiliibacter pulmonis TaxID=1443036 RepID=A0A3N4VY00_9PAST|nr:anhydro-N-acetylmuramic acid kinase [Vespertiliibacter pulmonis]QLB20244.1 anhydro-N-acetylmuramic acid kinase [Vespertiliibacter pulmonis]RPE86223.1 anhydro-N-acetylmuramic acid kinase [Vespertiliibacter pulmonis]
MTNNRVNLTACNPSLYIGVMSGTSLDGVDIALMDFSQSPKLLKAEVMPIPEDLRGELSQLVKSGEVTLQKLGELDHRLGLLYANSINQFLKKHNVLPENIRAIGCHGQTIWHAPQGYFPFTMQLGDMNLVAAKTRITVVGDFRRKDMAFGGQGAPLVPAFHQALFADPKRIVAVVNIGGISNVSLLIPNQNVIGYDIGAGNTLLDSWIEKHQGKPFDKDAEWAKQGNMKRELLAELLDDPFFTLLPPKSTGREQFNLSWLEKKLAKVTACNGEVLQAVDVQTTLVEFTAQSIANDLTKIVSQLNLPCLLLVCGGGARNPLLMERIKALMPNWSVSTTTQYGINADDVESAAFAWLAYQRMNSLAGNVPSVTGATQAVSLGAIFPYP